MVVQIHQVCLPSCFTKQSMDIYRIPSVTMFNKKNGNRKGSSSSVQVPRPSLETSARTVVIGEVTEVSQDTFWPLVNAAGHKIIVLDMYTQWCNPCKVIAPKFKELSQKFSDVLFLKLDCNQENKALAKELGLKVVPTFKILKDSKIIKEVTGAKFDNLAEAIDEVRSL
ncbi:hypothetical protein QVD17_41729 [Tagetes erecta]|uniref:Thioredoxin domain-containing protein n=1 Tax=Tagetes erecta TaxID=13708 RepID=A0AAD8JMN1_TARER|nr:hypothetical protein QVD17_41729 [Tagetes erecta]